MYVISWFNSSSPFYHFFVNTYLRFKRRKKNNNTQQNKLSWRWPMVWYFYLHCRLIIYVDELNASFTIFLVFFFFSSFIVEEKWKWRTISCIYEMHMRFGLALLPSFNFFLHHFFSFFIVDYDCRLRLSTPELKPTNFFFIFFLLLLHSA